MDQTNLSRNKGKFRRKGIIYTKQQGKEHHGQRTEKRQTRKHRISDTADVDNIACDKISKTN
jgi:hypothetical protein